MPELLRITALFELYGDDEYDRLMSGLSELGMSDLESEERVEAPPARAGGGGPKRPR